LDSSNLRTERLKEALDIYEQVKGKPITCSYTPLVGTPSGTNLPDNFCNKILLMDTYHHLVYRDPMIRDMARILKRDGKLIVYEPLARKPKELMKACGSEVFTQEHLISSFESNGFHLDKIYRTANNNRKKVRVFTFRKNAGELELRR
jgi:ubiquinone/menaquinone biosynthesis C-methylase UbiE